MKPTRDLLSGLFVGSLIMLAANYSYAVDQCNFTSQCKTQYGPIATDCADSYSDHSVCMCGSQPCDSIEPSAPTFAVPGQIEAEDYHRYFDTSTGNNGGQYRTDNVDIEKTTDLNAGFNVGWVDGNEWLEYDINVLNSGAHKATIRAASKPGNGMFTLAIDGTNRTNAIAVAATGGWQQWQNLQAELGELTAGKHTLRLNVLAGGFNINWIDVQKTTDTDNGSVMLGKFNTSKDLLLGHFDSKPDPDDIHAVAGLGTMLKDPRFSKVKYHAVSGAYGIQGGNYIEANNLFNLAFGANNWSNAHLNWSKALDETTSKVKATLTANGDIWIQEAGQSDFTADLVKRIKAQMPSINTKTRIHVIQHSQWNEDKTTPEDLSYVKQNTDYQKIDDGNSTNNATPGFNTKDGSYWVSATSNVSVGKLWTEAKKVADASIENHVGWVNPTIRDGGFDFSDVVEDTWIFGFNNLKNTEGFFNEFLN
ncbi:carbohydrate-binding protein [Simiduia curdlanivorans]|uniref:Carbohydrate-binding protein n=1 Tax=Simiduia curdlanivorans TaxID=1492769 RepID=A0ABV8V7M2_9GAMM|nr:carbohydrate-binding protein [Simiduia curdlanivorans]MDN3640745.1 carbohydrate-binding protein [Simiduia curdlanivorans]